MTNHRQGLIKSALSLGSGNISKRGEKEEICDSVDFAKETHYHNGILY